jgi:hypothetical protein
MATDEEVEAATKVLVEGLGPSNVTRLKFFKEPASTGVILEDIMGRALEAAEQVREKALVSRET